MLTLNQRNIHSIFVQANANDMQAGESWYFTANHICKQLSETYSIGLHQVCAVMAVLSPRCKWEKNIELCEMALNIHRLGGERKMPCLGVSTKKAFEILDGADPLVVIGGYKVLSFYRNILDPWTSDDVTVDTHAISIWTGSRCRDKETAPIFSSIKKYTAVAEDYKSVALNLSLLPHQVQAITWVTYKRINNI